ncbi:MAG TPA: alanine--glyoxylate aminotransferase family protein [Gemmatimonadaceae bacterium]
MSSPNFGTFFIPGPTEVRPEILQAMSRPLISHRGREFEAMFARIEAGLRDVFLTARPVYIGATSATGFMEMAIRNTPPGKILSLVNGAFSERFAKVAESCAREVRRLVVPWGQTYDFDVVKDVLASEQFVAVTVAHSETSTGVLTDVRTVAELAHQHRAIVLVDSVSGAGGAELTVDGWGLDFFLTGSQKALALPPGLAFAVASAEYVDRARALTDRGFYFDVVQYDNAAAKNETPSTPATSLLYALEAQLGNIMREGIEQRWERHLSMRDATLDWVSAVSERRDVDLRVVAAEGARSPTLTVIALPEGMTSREVIDLVAERGITIANGYGELRGKTIRIGHMGDHTLEGLERCLSVCEHAIAELAERRMPLRLRR